MANMKNPTGLQKFWKNYAGITLTVAGGFFFSISMLIVKALQQHHGVKAFGSALMFNIGVFIPSLLLTLFNEFGYGWKRRTRVLTGLRPFHMANLATLMTQGVLQGSAIALRAFALSYLPVGDMTVIVFASPVLTTILAHFVVGEECGAVFILIAIYTLIGVALITKPPMLTGEKEFDENSLIGSGLAGGALLCLSMKFVITRKIKDIHVLTMTLNVSAFGILISLPLFLGLEDPSTFLPSDMEGTLLRLGLFGAFFASAFVNLALKLENAGVVALFRSCDVIFAFVLQYFFLGVIPDVLSGIGAGIVWSGVLMAGLRKWRMEKRRSELAAAELTNTAEHRCSITQL